MVIDASLIDRPMIMKCSAKHRKCIDVYITWLKRHSCDVMLSCVHLYIFLPIHANRLENFFKGFWGSVLLVSRFISDIHPVAFDPTDNFVIPRTNPGFRFFGPNIHIHHRK